MSAAPPFLTIAARWKRHEAALAKLPQNVRALAQLMFFAGFSDGMEACVETAQYDEDTACRLLATLHNENAQLAARAQELLAAKGPTP